MFSTAAESKVPPRALKSPESSLSPATLDLIQSERSEGEAGLKDGRFRVKE